MGWNWYRLWSWNSDHSRLSRTWIRGSTWFWHISTSCRFSFWFSNHNWSRWLHIFIFWTRIFTDGSISISISIWLWLSCFVSFSVITIGIRFKSNHSISISFGFFTFSFRLRFLNCTISISGLIGTSFIFSFYRTLRCWLLWFYWSFRLYWLLGYLRYRNWSQKQIFR